MLTLNQGIRERLIDYRKAKGLTQPELARKLGVSVWTVCQVENGNRNPSQELLEAWAKVLGRKATVSCVVTLPMI